MMQRIVPTIVVLAVIALGLWLWWPAEELQPPDRKSDLGAALVGGAVVAIAALYLQQSLSTELSRHQSLSDAQFRQYVELWSQLQELRQAADDLWNTLRMNTASGNSNDR